ncbi:MAG TPA: MopE-related protein [Polyangia bacterium]|jgi:hypothetical protein
MRGGLVLALLAALAGCELRPFTLIYTDGGSVAQHDSGPLPDGAPPADDAGVVVTDGSIILDSGVVCPNVPEVCNGIDDDCNGVTDDVENLDSDPNNCGRCGRACVLPHATGSCVAGECTFTCLTGWVDTDADLAAGLESSNGCECHLSNGGAEICDGIDNDCNGVTDDGVLPEVGDDCFPAQGCAGGQCHGACHAGVKRCEAGELVCDGAQGPTPEVCDGVDNDCNGLVDDGVEARLCYGSASGCDVAAGTCQGSCKLGLQLCTGTGGWGACQGEVGPSPETCNALDDDCDGEVDNGLGLAEGVGVACYPPAGCPGGVCQGACAAGAQTCEGGRLVCVGAQGPAREVCDGVDNDCNGVADDGLVAQPCYTGATGCDLQTGQCRGSCRLGRRTCQGAGGWSACVGEILPQPETCNGLDDDCDGQIDNGLGLAEGVGAPCYPPYGCPGGVCKGECHAGAQQCQSGRLTCVGAQGPTPEVCDGLDNDCSGVADDGLPPRPCYTKGSGCDLASGTCLGICRLGQQLCTGAGGWGACQGDVGPQSEVCNGVDDDCNGAIDDGAALPGVGAPCYPAQGCPGGNCQGECHAGAQVCQDGGLTCVGARGPSQEVCDGLDNDCNGLVDDGLPPRPCYTHPSGCDPVTGACVGICRMGHRACEGAAGWGACGGDVGPRAETCNGIDDDCNGLVDDGLGAAQGVGAPCYPAQGCPGGNCRGTCKAGAQECQVGYLVCVGAVGPTGEVCDGLDNDCNGLVDDGLPPKPCYTHASGCDVATGTCQGVCRLGGQTCQGVAGWGACAGDTGPQPETCNGVDDDCNGLVDDGAMPGAGDACDPPQGCPGGVCKGLCHKGTRQCQNANLVCVGAQGPAPEVCDGQDNDCNGQVDDGLPPRPCYTHAIGCDVATSTCQGSCRLGSQACQGGGWAACAGDVGPQSETCNGVDDDCNGLVDDGAGIPGVGAPCYPAQGCPGGNCVGDCHAGGQQCQNGRLACVGAQGPVPEVCDGHDNDCNGTADDAIPSQPCYPFASGCDVATGQCQGSCRLGTRTCDGAGGWTACAGAVGPQPETCNGADDNCDGLIDNGLGVAQGVGVVCYPSAGCPSGACKGLCHAGAQQCTAGRLTCEGAQGPVAEVCDTFDNDCDGVADNGFDLQHDVANCGACGHDCRTLAQSANAWAYCDAGVCKRDCKAGFWDVDGNYANGCEYACTQTGAEVCDGIDNDCNGVTDDNPMSPGNFCRQQGACAGSTPSCQVFTPPAPPETGDDLNQLGGWALLGATDVNTDEGLLYVTLDSSGGTRTVSLYRDPTLTDLVASGSRAGDGLVALVERSSSGLSGSVSVTYQAPDSTITIAVPIKAWVCNYNPATVDLVGLNRIAPQETRCDNVDNNCDGSVDERFFIDHAQGSACQQGGVLGECRGYGRWACDPAGTAAVCDLTCGPPNCKPQSAPSPEVCDDKDNDCDGVVDNGITDDAAHVTAAGLDFWIFAYEASRPGATATSPGAADHRACSRPNVLPWTLVSYAGAQAACAASGKRLCTGAEWGAACGATAYPYGAAYLPDTCNGEDYDGIPGGVDDDVLIPTGQLAACVTPGTAVHDLSGNVKEWTNQITGTTPAPDNTPIAVVRGGAYDTPKVGLRCDFVLSRAATDVLLPTLGFRCCTPCPAGGHLCPTATACTGAPGQCTAPAFCDTATDPTTGSRHCARCVNAMTDPANCGGCGVVCSGACLNGVCR